MKYWLLLEKSDGTRTSKGIDGYRDITGESYHYDSLVPNHRNVATGDFAILRKENDIIGICKIGDISDSAATKSHRRCPKCSSTDIRESARGQTRWRCGKCAEKFSVPKQTQTEVRSYVATLNDFAQLNAPPSVKAVKMCAEKGNGLSSQLSMLRLNPVKIQTLFEGTDLSISSRSSTAGTGGQGFGLSQVERRAVELRAMQVARELYEDAGWQVIDMSSSRPFDLLATQDETMRFVEVKGTTGEGLSVLLTHGEVDHIRRNAERSSLVVVSHIVLEESNGECQAKGGTVTIHEDPWSLAETSLSATQYRYELRLSSPTGSISD